MTRNTRIFSDNEYISMRTYINSIRDLSNEYERSITDSSNEIDIKLLVDTFLEKIKTL